MDESESVSQTAGIDDLVSDSLGQTPEPEVAATPESSPEPAAEPAVAQEPVTDPPVAYEGQTAAQPAQPTPPAPIRIGDRDYTAQELQAALISAQQLPHLQKKYVEALEQSKSQPTPPSQPTQFDPKGYMQSLRQQYDPVVQRYAEQGLLSQDFVTLFPGEAAQMVHYQQGFTQVQNAVRAIASELQQRTVREQQTGLVNGVTRSLSALAESGEPFAPLKDPGKQQEFFNYLWELNPQTSQLANPDFLARQWIAFNKDQYLQAAQAKAVQAARTQQARLARADATGGARPSGVMQEPAKTPLDEMFEDHLERTR